MVQYIKSVILEHVFSIRSTHRIGRDDHLVCMSTRRKQTIANDEDR